MIVLQKTAFSLIKSRLALGSPGCSVVVVSPFRKWPDAHKKGCWMPPSDHIHRWNPFTDQTRPRKRNNWSSQSFEVDSSLLAGHSLPPFLCPPPLHQSLSQSSSRDTKTSLQNNFTQPNHAYPRFAEGKILNVLLIFMGQRYFEPIKDRNILTSE